MLLGDYVASPATSVFRVCNSLQVYLIFFFYLSLLSRRLTHGLGHCHGWSTSPGSHQL